MSVLSHGDTLFNLHRHKRFSVTIWITRTQTLEMKQLTDRIPKEIYLPYNTVMRLRSAELKGESEMVHRKWKQCWQSVWDSVFYCHSLSQSLLGWPSFIVKVLPTSSHFFSALPEENILPKCLSNLGISTYSTRLVPCLPLGSIRTAIQWTPTVEMIAGCVTERRVCSL